MVYLIYAIQRNGPSVEVLSSLVLQNRSNMYFLLLRHIICSWTCVLEQCEMVLLQFERRAWLHDSRLASQPGGRLALEMGQVIRWVAGGLRSCFRKIEKALDTAVNRCCALPRWLGPNYSGDLQLEENYPSGGKLEQLWYCIIAAQQEYYCNRIGGGSH